MVRLADSNQNRMIIRTERGLSISGTRITLYDVMDYLIAQYPIRFIRSFFNLTEEQMNVAIAYIEAHRADVEAEYQVVLMQAEESRQYWEERNREHFARVKAMPPKPGQEVLWEKLREQKARNEAEA